MLEYWLDCEFFTFRLSFSQYHLLLLGLYFTFFQFQGLIQAFDDDDDQTLTADEKTTLITTLASNPEIALYKFILNQKVQIPILPYFGACGRLSFVQARIPLHF